MGLQQILSSTSLPKPNMHTEFTHKMVDRWNADGLYCLKTKTPTPQGAIIFFRMGGGGMKKLWVTEFF